MTDATEWEGVLLGQKVRRSVGDAQMVRSLFDLYGDNLHDRDARWTKQHALFQPRDVSLPPPHAGKMAIACAQGITWGRRVRSCV